MLISSKMVVNDVMYNPSIGAFVHTMRPGSLLDERRNFQPPLQITKSETTAWFKKTKTQNLELIVEKKICYKIFYVDHCFSPTGRPVSSRKHTVHVLHYK